MSDNNSDLYRNFAIGFAVGAFALFVQSGPDLFTALIPDAIAAVIR